MSKHYDPDGSLDGRDVDPNTNTPFIKQNETYTPSDFDFEPHVTSDDARALLGEHLVQVFEYDHTRWLIEGDQWYYTPQEKETQRTLSPHYSADLRETYNTMQALLGAATVASAHHVNLYVAASVPLALRFAPQAHGALEAVLPVLIRKTVSVASKLCQQPDGQKRLVAITDVLHEVIRELARVADCVEKLTQTHIYQAFTHHTPMLNPPQPQPIKHNGSRSLYKRPLNH